VGLRALAGVAETRWPSLAPWLLRTPFAAAGVAAALINQLALPFGKAGLHLGLVVTSGVAFAMAFVGAPFAAVTSGRRMAGGGSWRGFS